MSLMPTYLVSSRNTVRDDWRAEFFEVELAVAVRAANTIARSGAFCACVMEVSGQDAMPSFTFKYATKGPR